MRTIVRTSCCRCPLLGRSYEEHLALLILESVFLGRAEHLGAAEHRATRVHGFSPDPRHRLRVSFCRLLPKAHDGRSPEMPKFSRILDFGWWALWGLNLQPLPCEGNAL